MAGSHISSGTLGRRAPNETHRAGANIEYHTLAPVLMSGPDAQFGYQS